MADSDVKQALKDAAKKLAEIVTKGSHGKANETKTQSGNTPKGT